MSETPFTDKTWESIQAIPKFSLAVRMRDACQKMERQRNELLEALEAIIKADDEAEAIMREMGIPPEEPMDILDAARAAIAKAKGETP